jgi:hypothetical protein
VDWRDRIRGIVNRPSELSRWRLALLRGVDPVEWYMRKDEDRPRRVRTRTRHPVGWVAYSPLAQQVMPGEPGGPGEPPRIPSDVSEGRVESRSPSRLPYEEWETRTSTLRERYHEYFATRAQEVVDGRSVAISTPDGTVRVRLARFRNGAVLEHDVVTPEGVEHGMTRMDRQALQDAIPPIAAYLIGEVAKLGPSAEPLP